MQIFREKKLDGSNYLESTVYQCYHFFRQLWLVLGVKLMEIHSSNFLSRYKLPRICLRTWKFTEFRDKRFTSSATSFAGTDLAMEMAEGKKQTMSMSVET